MLAATLPATYVVTRLELQRVAAHVLARARHAATGRFGLRVTPGGFGTPAFGPDAEVVRVAGAHLVREQAGREGASTTSAPIAGAALAELATAAGVDLDPAFRVGHDTPALGDAHAALDVDPDAAQALGAWFGFAARVLDHALAQLGSDAMPTVVQVWPEHFDVGVDVAARSSRINLGASPGDSFDPHPYLYVGPWELDRYDGPFWNAPFGAVLRYAELVALGPEAIGKAVAFLVEGVAAR